MGFIQWYFYNTYNEPNTILTQKIKIRVCLLKGLKLWNGIQKKKILVFWNGSYYIANISKVVVLSLRLINIPPTSTWFPASSSFITQAVWFCDL
jgi:hypothetical protein